MNKLLIICGLSFAGKSTLGNAIAQAFNYSKVDLDDTKFHLYGPTINDEELGDDDWERVYRETYKQIEDYLSSGKTVVHDSGNFSRDERAGVRELARKRGAEVVTIYVDTPEPIARQRLRANRERRTRLDVTDKDFDEAIQAMEPPDVDEKPLLFRHGTDLAEWIARNSAMLRWLP